MRQTGYLIENLLNKKHYFTSTSSYDRPRWVEANQASVYESADSAERAMKKMIKYGVNSVRLVNLSELSITQPPVDLPPEDEMPEDQLAMDLPPEDIPADDASPEDEMVAQDQVDAPIDSEYRTDITSDEHQEGDEINIDELPPEDAIGQDPMADELSPEENEEITNKSSGFSRGHSVSYKGMKYVVVADDGNGNLQIAQADAPTKIIRVNASELLPVSESATIDSPAVKGEDIAGAPDEKITVPANVKSGLDSVIQKYSDEAKTFTGRDDARASFAMTIADAAAELKELISAGTVESIKQAQIKYSTYMNAITTNFPAEVVKFIASGGRKPTLKDLFDSKRAK